MQDHEKTWILALLIGLGLTVVTLQQLGIIDLQTFGVYVQDMGTWGFVLYGLLFVVLGMLGFSKIAMTVLAGVLFSFVEAMVITVIAATIAGVLAFFAARHFSDSLHTWLQKRAQRHHSSKLHKLIYRIEQNAEERGFFYIALLRLSFVPLMMTCYASGLIHALRFRDFFWAIFLTNIYMHFVYIFVGTSIRQSLPLFLIAILILVLFYQTPKLFRRIQNTSDDSTA